MLLAFDEFQDIYDIPEALAIFRTHLQKLKEIPMIFLGSKRKLLSAIFASNESPFFNFAEEHVLHPVQVEDWQPFFAERLNPVKSRIAQQALTLLCQECLDVPNTICEVGAFIQDFHRGTSIDAPQLRHILSELIDRKSETYRYQLSLLSRNEVAVCKALAVRGFTTQLSSHDFCTRAGLGASTIKKIATKLYHAGVVEEEQRGFRLSNPVLSMFLKYRSY